MNLELFLRYCLDRYIKDSDNTYFKYVHVGINDLYIFKTQESKVAAPDVNKEITVDLIKDYHFGIITEEISSLMQSIYSGHYYIEGRFGTNYVDLINRARKELEYRPSLLKEKIRQDVKPEYAHYKNLSIEMSDVLYTKLLQEMAMVAVHINSEEFELIYNEIKNKDGLTFSFVLEKYFDIESYIEKLAVNYAELLTFLTDDKIANFMSYIEYQINTDRRLQNDYTKGDILLNSNVSVMRFARAYSVLLKFLEVYPNTVTNRNIVTINTGLNIVKIRNIIVNIFNVLNLEANMQYIFNDNWNFIYDSTNDTTNVILRYLHSIILSKPNQFETGDLLNDMVKKEFKFSSRHIMKLINEPSAYKNEIARNNDIIEDIMNRDLVGTMVFHEMLDTAILNAVKIYEAVAENGEVVTSKISDKMYEVYYKAKKFMVDKKSQKYENLLNEISKDLTLIQSNATEYITVTEKNNLLREAHAIKGELIKIKGKAKSMNDEKLLDLIEEREDFAEDVITLVNKRTIRKERKGTSFKLERDMTDQLKGMQHDGDYYGDEE